MAAGSLFVLSLVFWACCSGPDGCAPSGRNTIFSLSENLRHHHVPNNPRPLELKGELGIFGSYDI
jgi:hypothetical protein